MKKKNFFEASFFFSGGHDPYVCRSFEEDRQLGAQRTITRELYGAFFFFFLRRPHTCSASMERDLAVRTRRAIASELCLTDFFFW